MRTTIFFQKKVGWPRQVLSTVLPVATAIILLLLVLSPPTFPSLALHRYYGTVLVTSTGTSYNPFNLTLNGDGVREVEFWIMLGPGGGCEKYDDKAPICRRTLHFRPPKTHLHLPPQETLSGKLPNMNWLVIFHMTLVAVVLGIISFCLGPFVPGCYFVSTATTFLAVVLSLIDVIAVNFGFLSMNKSLNGSNPNVYSDTPAGYALVYVVLVMTLASMFIIKGVASKIKLNDPPKEGGEENEGVEMHLRGRGQTTTNQVNH
ncbi:hypothetical protein I302_102226 [Kwoniella bestiolae CBS 10118]|uniref:Uncharacterized protein n=1 Tax=Kwoniella bestiolae CBS 10118 TaxID=1296100 RepID=A0A1B9GEG5_9TREE|nr:hypothetical protein I302_00915 [Kwoniella bestiolae CBS 10118]OCF29410.1 hypothetical protein I302_00915 [Kwoniella bestiolae CBS 10118]